MTRKAASSLRAFRSFLGLHDVHDLFARDFADLYLVRFFRTGSDVRRFLQKNRRGRTLGDEGERLVFENGDHDGENVAGLFLGGGVKFLAERHDVDATRSERGADGRRRIGLSGGNLQFDVSYDFFGHTKFLLRVERFLDYAWNDRNCYPRSTCQYSSSTGVARPKIVTETRSLPRSGSISSTMPF